MRGRKKSDDTRRAIVECASEIFAKREFHEVLTEDIADRLGIGKGTMYRYFRSKEELFLATVSSGFDGLLAAVRAGLEEEAPLAPTIETLVRNVVTHFWRKRDYFVLLQRLESKIDPALQAQWQAQRDDVVRMVRRELDHAAAHGEIRKVNSRLAVEALFGMIRALCVYRADSDRPEEITKSITQLFLGGIGAKSGSDTTAPASSLRIVRGGNSR